MINQDFCTFSGPEGQSQPPCAKLTWNISEVFHIFVYVFYVYVCILLKNTHINTMSKVGNFSLIYTVRYRRRPICLLFLRKRPFKDVSHFTRGVGKSVSSVPSQRALINFKCGCHGTCSLVPWTLLRPPMSTPPPPPPYVPPRPPIFFLGGGHTIWDSVFKSRWHRRMNFPSIRWLAGLDRIL